MIELEVDESNAFREGGGEGIDLNYLHQLYPWPWDGFYSRRRKIFGPPNIRNLFLNRHQTVNATYCSEIKDFQAL